MSNVKYADYTRNTTEPLKAFAHKRRYNQALDIISPKIDDSIIDYGCGDGYLLELMSSYIPKSNMTAFDPDKEMISQISDELYRDIVTYDNRLDLLSNNKNNFSLIICIEVLEHLSPSSVLMVLDDFHHLAAPGAKIVIGVPIETGLSGFFKNIYRYVLGRRMGANLGSIFGALFGAKLPRMFTASGWTPSHIGFRESDLINALEMKKFKVKKGNCVPFKVTGRTFNNESYLICSV